MIPLPEYNNLYGYFYYIYPLQGIKLAHLFDFVRIDINHPEGYELRTGMPYLLQAKEGKVFYLHFIHEWLQDITLIPYMQRGQIFIFQ